MTMETYFQKGVQPACRLEELPNNVKCPPVWNPPPAPPLADGTLVFGTESCMGCHSSAGEACRRPDAGDLKMVTEWAKLGFVIRNPFLPPNVYDTAATGTDLIYVSVEPRQR